MATVVIIDDQFTSRLILEQLISTIDASLNIVTFNEPEKALEWAHEHVADLVITDYMMPQMNGFALTRGLRQIPEYADVPILVISILFDDDTRSQAEDAGATKLLPKPVDHQVCRAVCKTLLSEREPQLQKSVDCDTAADDRQNGLLIGSLFHRCRKVVQKPAPPKQIP